MAKPWQPAPLKKGVRFYTVEGRPRLRNGTKDKCWGIRYRVNSRKFEAILGWTSEGWSEKRAFEKRQYYIDNAKTGSGPASPAEEKELAEKLRSEQERRDKSEALKNIPFKDFVDNEYLPVAEVGWKPETARKHKEHCKNWLNPAIGEKSFSLIQMKDLNKIKAKMKKDGRAPRTMQAVFRTFDMIWTYARDAGLTNEPSPTKKKSFKLPKIDNERERFLSFDEADRLLIEVKKKSQQAHDMALLSLHTGMRFSEIARLQWQHVDLANGLIYVFDSKGKSRTLEMANAVTALFNSFNRGRGDALVFPNKTGKVQTQIPSSFKRAIDDAGLNEGVTDPKLRFGFHGLRHTRASWLRKAGADLYTIQRILGHTTPIMTQRYSHIEHQEIRSATDAVDRMLEADKNDGKTARFKKESND